MKKLVQRLAMVSVAVGVAAVVAGCGGEPTTPSGGEESDAPVVDTRAPAVEGTATIKGKVTLLGDPPEMPELAGMDGKPECADMHDTPLKAEVVLTGPDGALLNVFVYISKGVTGHWDPPQEPVMYDQRKCVYLPHVIGIQVGQPLHVTNSDPFLHNVHVLLSRALKETNRSQPQNSPAIKLKFNRPYIGVSVKCDVHTWMQAYACVVDHPFFSVSGADGGFEFPARLPVGTYTVTAWHEKYGTSDQDVTVGEGETKEINFEFQAD